MGTFCKHFVKLWVHVVCGTADLTSQDSGTASGWWPINYGSIGPGDEFH